MKTVIEAGAARSLRDPRGLWRSRELLLLLAWRDFRVRYRQTVVGAAWAVVEPLVSALVFTLLFHGLAKLDAGFPYPLFCFAGTLAWTHFARTLRGTSVSLVANAGLLSKTYFPRLLLPASASVVSVVDLGFSLIAYVPLALYFHSRPGVEVLLLPVWVLLAGICATGLGAALSVLNVRMRDVTHALPLLTQVWMLLTPVAWPLSSAPPHWRAVLILNPLAGIVEGMRWSLLPGYPLPPDALAAALLGTVLCFSLGLLCFHLGERDLADVA